MTTWGCLSVGDTTSMAETEGMGPLSSASSAYTTLHPALGPRGGGGEGRQGRQRYIHIGALPTLGENVKVQVEVGGRTLLLLESTFVLG